MTPAQWRLARQVTSLLGTEPAMTDASLADQLGVSEAELRPVTGMLAGRGLVERCGAYLVLVTPPAQSPGGGA
jgi:hypothetical protein